MAKQRLLGLREDMKELKKQIKDKQKSQFKLKFNSTQLKVAENLLESLVTEFAEPAVNQLKSILEKAEKVWEDSIKELEMQ